MFGDGTESYIEAYNIDTNRPNGRKIAQIDASKLLLQPTILHRINFLLESNLGFNDQHVDKQLAFLITQSADLKAKLAAIREYNALRGRIRHKLELDVTSKSMPELDTEYAQLEREIALAQQILEEREEEDMPVGMPVLTDDQKTAVRSGEAAFMEGIVIDTTPQ